MFEAESQIQGWCPVEFMGALNRMVAAMPPDQSYLEIGTFCGRSLAAALKDNNASAIVIDPLDLWTQNGFIHEILAKTIKNFNLQSRVMVHTDRSETFTQDLPKIGVFFYDGNHDSGHTYESLCKFLPFLADEAIVIVDDVNIDGGGGQRPYPGHTLELSRPVAVDVDRWIGENKAIITSVMYTDWGNSQAIINIKK